MPPPMKNGFSVLEKISIFAKLLPLPGVVLGRYLLSFFSAEREKTWRRVLFDAAFRWVVYTQTIPHMAQISGTTGRVVRTWAKQHNIEISTDDSGEGGQLLWIGSKRTEKVIIYLHGGGYSIPMSECAADMWSYIQDQVRKGCGQDVGVAVLEYTLVPDAYFPIPLRQAIAAVKHIMAMGTLPENIQIAGDSAGANLTLQLFLHMLHPIPGVPALPPATKFRGAYLMSPWVTLIPRSNAQSYADNRNLDILTGEKLEELGTLALQGVKDEAALPYLDTYFAPAGWYDGFEKVVDRVLITTGGAECLRDDIAVFAEKFCSINKQAKFVMDKVGVHNDPMYDFLAGETRLSELTPMVVQWFIKGFSTQ
ncbi:Alpha/Beta hydrolase protein [Crassisporium funariophilum]|nr:Alpha/Beta hydrolase protein [Crassisporium funariophilum]